MALILCIETATPLCSVALCRNGEVLAVREENSERNVHAERINVFIEEVLDEAGLEIQAVQAVAVGIGPGSFTGLRIGLSAAKGLCYALDVPIIGISTLQALCAVLNSANGKRTEGTILYPMIDARRAEVFTAAHDHLGAPLEQVHPCVLDEAMALHLDRSGSAVVLGSGADKLPELWKVPGAPEHVPHVLPHAWAYGRIAEERLVAGAVDDLAYLVPAYGKDAKPTPSNRPEIQ